MSGDVFGNGMLLSRHIRLVGAFNHQHVFLDPDPDPETSFAERERLFALPRSSWSDYDTAKISEGGGVFPRSAKSIPLSEQVRAVLDVEAEALTPSELIHAMLKAPVDLLWNGGIGTYVKAARETHADVGDRANDAVRVNGGELQAKVVGEGGNLGFTQLGRIEYALHGGRINTDFIDNSGGVDCSDHEVNIKILLNQVVDDGDMTRKQRDKLLADMTDDVATAVLQDNYRQVQAISVTEAQAPQLLDEHARLMRRLERANRLDRRLEFLPNNEELAERRAAGKGLTRPELAVLLAYAKIVLQDELVASDVPEDEYLADDLERYMPPKLREKFRSQLRRHPLRRDIIATYVTNSMVNRAGSTFANRLRDETGASPPDVARAYTVAREVFDIRRLWKDLATLDNVVPAEVQLELQAEGRKMIERSALWFLRNRRQPLDIAATVSHFAPGIASLAQELPKLLAPADSDALDRLAERFTAAGVPAELATRVASLDALFSGLNVIEVATACGETVEAVAAVYFALGYKLDLHWLRDQIAKLPAETHWQTLAQGALRDDLYSEQRELTAEVLKPGTEDRGRRGPDRHLDGGEPLGGRAGQRHPVRPQGGGDARHRHAVGGPARDPQPERDRVGHRQRPGDPMTVLAYEVAGSGPGQRCCWCTPASPTGGCGTTRWTRSPRPAGRWSGPTCPGSARPRLPPGRWPCGRPSATCWSELGVDRAVVVGCSLGGRAAVDLALAAPERVRALVLVGSSLAGHRFQEPALFELWDQSEGALERGDHREAARVEIDTWVAGMDRPPEAVDPEVRRRVTEMLLTAYAHGEADLEEPDPPAAGRLGEITAPTLVVVGEHDRPDIQAMADALAAGIPGAERVVLDGTAHLPSMERPDEFNRVVLGFLAKLDRSP